MGQEYNEKKFCPHIIHPAWCPGWFTLGDFLEKESKQRTSRGEADQTFLFSKILEVHGRRRHHLNGGLQEATRVNQHPPAHHAGRMVCGEETLFHRNSIL
jgi:hypothetical protein